jgi:hypothetical protein
LCIQLQSTASIHKHSQTHLTIKHTHKHIHTKYRNCTLPLDEWYVHHVQSTLLRVYMYLSTCVSMYVCVCLYAGVCMYVRTKIFMFLVLNWLSLYLAAGWMIGSSRPTCSENALIGSWASCTSPSVNSRRSVFATCVKWYIHVSLIRMIYTLNNHSNHDDRREVLVAICVKSRSCQCTRQDHSNRSVATCVNPYGCGLHVNTRSVLDNVP